MMDQEQRKIVIALLIVTVVSAGLLGLTDMLTRAPIAAAEKEALHVSLEQVLPPHSNDAQADSFTLQGRSTVYYPARDEQGKLLGIAWETVAPDGYSGTIRILLGVNPEGSIQGIRITFHRETPGLGDAIASNQAWIDSFSGKTLGNTRWGVKKDGGDFDQFTGATISPRAVVKAVHQALGMYAANRPALITAAMPVQDASHE